ncbi:hypothetical protein GEMRC1_006585 [Eukaryota sp. GEM-RC1]
MVIVYLSLLNPFPLFPSLLLCFQFQELSEFVTERMAKGLDNLKENNFKLDSMVIISKIVESRPSDVRVSYKDTTCMMNSVLLSLFSSFFYNSFTCEFADSDVRSFEYSDQFPGVAEDTFSQFFDLFHFQSIILTVSKYLGFFPIISVFPS